MAKLHKVAGDVELATPDGEGWCIELEPNAAGGRIYLELNDGTASEADLGIAILHKVAAAGRQ